MCLENYKQNHCDVKANHSDQKEELIEWLELKSNDDNKKS